MLDLVTANKTIPHRQFRRGPGRAPFGYRETAEGIEVNGNEQDAVAFARRLRRAGKSLRYIADRLNEEEDEKKKKQKFETRTGSPWTMRKVQSLLRSPSIADLQMTYDERSLLRKVVHALRHNGPLEVEPLAELVDRPEEVIYAAVKTLERRGRVVVDGQGLKAVVELRGRGTGHR